MGETLPQSALDMHPNNLVHMYGMTSDTILEATLRLIARGGVDAVRYRDVAAGAGVPLGTVSYHFPSRELLLRAAFSHFLAGNTRALGALRERFSLSTARGLAAFLTEVLRVDFADPERGYLAEFELILYAGRDPVIAEALAAWDRSVLAELAVTLERLGVPAPNAAARTLLDVMRGFQLTNLGRKPDLDDLEQRLRRVLTTLARKGKAHHAHPQAR
jgi:TetR/AcrR family transcriptional regulator, regulator of biofilm formation and stress response